MVDTGVISKTYPGMKKRQLPELKATLVQAGWSQVCKVPSAPAQSRFVRVPGGWRPRRPLIGRGNDEEPASPVSSKFSGTEGDMSPRWSVPTRSLKTNSSQDAVTHIQTSPPSALALSRPDGLEREKRPYRRDPHLSKELHLWPEKFLKEQERRIKAPLAGDPLDTALEELKHLPKRDGRDGSSSGSSRRSSPGPSAPINARRASLRRGSVGDLAEKLRRASLASICVSEKSDSDGGGGEHCAAARQAAEAAQTEAEEEGLPAQICRQRRLEAYAEALLREPEIQQLQAERLRGEEVDEVDSDLEKLIKEDLAELAELFAEFDGGLEGIIQQHDLRSLLRLLGRSLSEDDVRALIRGLDPLNDENEMREIGFKEFVELCDMRLHSEKLYLRAFFRDRFRGASSNCIQPHLRDVAEALQGVKVHVRPEQVERIALDLGHAVWAEFVTLVHETELYVLAQRCRIQEKQRAWERAGFTLEQVSKIQELYEHFVSKTGRGLRAEELLYIVHQLGMTSRSRSDEADMDATAYNGKDRSETMSLGECLHSARRFLDKKEMDARSKELRAAANAGIPQDELDFFRVFYKQLIAEDTQGNKKDFTYFALCRGVQIMGATLTVERNAELEQMFKEQAVSSGSSSQLPHLPFPKFIFMIGTLFKSDFASLRTKSALKQEEVQLRRSSANNNKVPVKVLSATSKFLMRSRFAR